MSKYEKLFQPGKIGNIEIKNRLVMGPMGNLGMCNHYGGPNNDYIEYFVTRARGGIGLIYTGVILVTTEIEKFGFDTTRNMMVDLSNFEYMDAWRELTRRVHAYGAKIFAQLGAGFGRVAMPFIVKDMVSASENENVWDTTQKCRALSIEEIEQLVSSFVSAAVAAQSFGFDGVNLHGHEGYLLDQITSPLWNKREDKYGSSFEKRTQFPLEVIQGIQNGCGKDFPITYRLDLTHDLPGGRDIEEGIKLVKFLESIGIAALDVDKGTYDNWHWPHPPAYHKAGCMVDMAAIAKHNVSIPVMAIGKLGDPSLAESVLAEEKADFIILARPLLADPEWPLKVRRGEEKYIRPCIGDHEGCLGAFFSRFHLGCSLNPATGFEGSYTIQPTEKEKRIMIVGAGPAGIHAARILHKRGHSVEIYEKNDFIGGQLREASAIEIKKDMSVYMEYLRNITERDALQVNFNCEVTPEFIKEKAPDVLVIATGAMDFAPQINGIDRNNVMSARKYLKILPHLNDKDVIVIGGGNVGCEVAYDIAHKGNRVTIIEILPTVMQNTFHANREMLLNMLLEYRVTLITGATVKEITETGVVMLKNGSETTLAAHHTVYATEAKPNDNLYRAALNFCPEVYNIGDSVKPGRLLETIASADEIARHI